MLFLLKRKVTTSLTALFVLTAVGLTGRHYLGDNAASLRFSPWLLLLGGGVCGGVLVSDGLIHGVLWLVFRAAYLRRHTELASVFREQTPAAILCGALLAGIGEELVFRGLGTSLWYLLSMALLFGVLHHIRGSLWYVTVWSIWEGVLFALTLYFSGELVVTMTGHFLHDLIGFLIFRWHNRTLGSRQEAISR